MIANYLGIGADLIEIRKQHLVSMSGSTLKGISELCDRLQLSSRAVRCEVSELGKLRTPCVLHWRFNHFVVLNRVGKNHCVVHDPARGEIRESHAAIAEAFTGVAVEISARPEFRKRRPPPRLRLSALWPVDSALLPGVSAGLLLALVCELLVLASPFYLQVVIDQVLGKGDTMLLNVLAAAFGVLLIFQIVANSLRRLTFQYLSQLAVFDITARILNKLLVLPLTYFRSRDLGDLQHRINALRRVQDFIVHSAPALIVDLLFMVLIIGLMAAYDLGLTLFALVITLTWFLWRALLLPYRLRLSGAIAHAESSIETHFLETLRAIQTIKLASGEAVRLSEWRNLFADGINEKIRAGNIGILDLAIRQLLLQGLRIACVYFLAIKALAGQLSIGMVSAFVAYLGMYISRASAIGDRTIEFRLLEVPLNRIADIVFADDIGTAPSESETEGSGNDVELRNVAFTYAPDEPWILNDCSCRIGENRFVAITGPSGVGKSTLLNLIAGVESAGVGEILVGGARIGESRLRFLREGTATVFQGDGLLKGTVAENIALFDTDLDHQRIRESACLACIDEEIERLPMAYETCISDLGSSFSRGQIQRLILARAFYRRPKLLLLDEATSGLDACLERRVIQSIFELEATRIVITHSDNMLAAADEVLWLHNGTLLSSRPELNV